MPKLEGRKSTFQTYPPTELLIGYFCGDTRHDRKYRCICCGQLFHDGFGGGMAVRPPDLETTIGWVCPADLEKIGQT